VESRTLQEINTKYALDIIDFFTNEMFKDCSWLLSYDNANWKNHITFRMKRKLEMLKVKGVISNYRISIDEAEKLMIRDHKISSILDENVGKLLGILSVDIRININSDIVQRKYNICT
jgi:hypothetical protein